MNRLHRFAALAVLSILLSSCAVWTHMEGGRMNGPGGITLEPPAGWMRYNQAGGDIIALTLDGMPIQTLRVELRKHEKAFPRIKKSSSPDLLPSEAAELTLAELKSAGDLANLRLIDNAPYKLAGKLGFRLHGQYRDTRGAGFDLVVVGRPIREGLLLVFYRALSVHYFARDLKTFEQTAASIRLGGT